MGRHRRRKGHARTGLISASAALAVGAVAVTSGLLPGLGDGLTPSDSAGHRAAERSAATSSSTPERESAPAPAGGTTEPGERETSPAATPTPTPTPTREKPSPEEPEPDETAPAPAPEPTSEAPEPEREAAPEPASPSPDDAPAPSTDPEQAAAEAVLALVNEERTAAGCQALTLDPALSGLAAGFSLDMAERDFFSHVDPDGRDPWDRAAASDVTNLGGENIAWGQPNPEAVMDAWMTSEGHRANILNCSFTTLGIGVHIDEGGPWWTQEFGF
ncbi:CAP domain-containing protein [Streptomyces sp. NBC_01803]|uniref:CAP domain-containing protein n=1 Tax=Streptomyces sp. NBC_01803 TaxID=2975946 RepID=UPI002DD9D2DB|nr:CAP domain-containing protein [Streptomyces sp. NBC_01803]WSA43996.1 CAP domain-containing protein [Streptomyces sp. NBC_01803]